jgi:hypothetical protein
MREVERAGARDRAIRGTTSVVVAIPENEPFFSNPVTGPVAL